MSKATTCDQCGKIIKGAEDHTASRGEIWFRIERQLDGVGATDTGDLHAKCVTEWLAEDAKL